MDLDGIQVAVIAFDSLVEAKKRDDYSDQQPYGVRSSASQGGVETHNRRDRRKERLGVASQAHRDHPCGNSRGGLLRNWPDWVRPSAKHRS
jgi:hypothetical protein